MTTQVVNACFHVFFSFYFQDFSPGAITGVLLYLPVNYLIFKAAIREGYLNNMKEVFGLFIIGASTFALFEMLGPIVMLGAVLLSVVYYFAVLQYKHV